MWKGLFTVCSLHYQCILLFVFWNHRPNSWKRQKPWSWERLSQSSPWYGLEETATVAELSSSQHAHCACTGKCQDLPLHEATATHCRCLLTLCYLYNTNAIILFLQHDMFKNLELILTSHFQNTEKSKDWYKTMFKQIHKIPGKIFHFCMTHKISFPCLYVGV